MNLYQSSGLVDAQIMDELKKYLLPRGTRILLTCAIGACIALGFFYTYLKLFTYTVVFSVLAIALLVEYFWLQKKAARVFLARLNEKSGGQGPVYAVSFAEDYLTGDTGQLPYDSVTGLYETLHCYLLITRAKRCAIVFKSSLGKREQAWLAFLRGKCANLR